MEVSASLLISKFSALGVVKDSIGAHGPNLNGEEYVSYIKFRQATNKTPRLSTLHRRFDGYR